MLAGLDNNKMYNRFYEAPYYLQPEFTIPILTAFVIVFVIVIFAYVCVRRAKHRAATNSCKWLLPLNFIIWSIVINFAVFVDGATLSKQFTGYSTTPRYADFDKVSGKPLIMTEQGTLFPTPYATMPMDDGQVNNSFI